MPAGDLIRSCVASVERCFAPCTARFTGGEILRRKACLLMKQKVPLRLQRLKCVETPAARIPVAVNPPSRLLGLALLRRERAGPGLLLPRCRSVHTFGMLFRLDIHFIGAAGDEIRVARAVPPCRFLFERDAVAVLEVPAEGGESSPSLP